MRRSGLLLTVSVILAGSAHAATGQTLAPAAPIFLPPATKLEGFIPAPGSIVTTGHDELGFVEGISVDVREVRDDRGNSAKGVVVAIAEEQAREVSFLDADEVTPLIKAIDALLDVRANPTSFRSFEMQYTTRGELQVTAFNGRSGNIVYAVQAGRVTQVLRRGLTASELLTFRGFLDTAAQKLAQVK